MDQHYLPECYLKSFCNDGEFYSIDINLCRFKAPYPQPKRPRQVCYKPHFYTIDDDFKSLDIVTQNIDSYFIENEFHKYEVKFQNYIQLIKDRTTWIGSSVAIEFMFALVDLKIRNQYLREKVFEKHHPNVVNGVLDRYLSMNDLSFLKEYDLKVPPVEIFRDVVLNLKESILNDKSLSKQAHLNSLLQSYKGLASIHDKIISTLLFYPWIVFTSNNRFFTSDNPGCSIDKQSLVHNTHFEKDFAFVFPLTPSHCLCIIDQRIDLNYYENTAYKHLHYLPLSDSDADGINYMLMNNTRQYVFSPDKDLLFDFAKKVNTQIGGTK